MDRYNRAWRDAGSPLTPITPLTSQVFNFDLGPSTPTPTNYLTVPPPRHFTREFMRIRSVFSPNAQSTTTASDSHVPPKHIKQERNTTRVDTNATSGPHLKRQFKRSSPVTQPTLSPRVRSLLNRTGNEHLSDLFMRQEIDIQVLIRMTLEDLESLGVRGAKELKLAMEVIKFAKNLF